MRADQPPGPVPRASSSAFLSHLKRVSPNWASSHWPGHCRDHFPLDPFPQASGSLTPHTHVAMAGCRPSPGGNASLRVCRPPRSCWARSSSVALGAGAASAVCPPLRARPPRRAGPSLPSAPQSPGGKASRELLSDRPPRPTAPREGASSQETVGAAGGRCDWGAWGDWGGQ